MRRLLAISAAVALAMMGGQLGHAAANAVAGSPAGGAELSANQGAMIAVAVGLAALLVIGLVGSALSRAADDAVLRVHLVVFACVPPAVFVAQEYVEYLLQHGSVSATTLAHPASVLGLALQLPFAWVAWRVARGLLRMVRRVADAVRRWLAPRAYATCARVLPRRAASGPAGFRAVPMGRGPPAVAAG